MLIFYSCYKIVHPTIFIWIEQLFFIFLMFFYFVDKHFCEDTCLTETYAQVYKGVECNDCILLSSLWLAIYPSAIHQIGCLWRRCVITLIWGHQLRLRTLKVTALSMKHLSKRERVGLVVFIKQIYSWQFPI